LFITTCFENYCTWPLSHVASEEITRQYILGRKIPILSVRLRANIERLQDVKHEVCRERIRHVARLLKEKEIACV